MPVVVGGRDGTEASRGWKMFQVKPFLPKLSAKRDNICSFKTRCVYMYLWAPVSMGNLVHLKKLNCSEK